jgi:hypothetical protein
VGFAPRSSRSRPPVRVGKREDGLRELAVEQRKEEQNEEGSDRAEAVVFVGELHPQDLPQGSKDHIATTNPCGDLMDGHDAVDMSSFFHQQLALHA